VDSAGAGTTTLDVTTLLGRRAVHRWERTSIGDAGRPVEHSRFYIVPETYEFRLNISGPLQISSSIQPLAHARSRERELGTLQHA